MKESSFDTIIFDVDGTLLDTLTDLVASTNFALRTHGFAQRSADEVRSFIGDGGPTLILRALPVGADEATHKAVFETFVANYSIHMNDHTQPYPGIIALLEALSKRGIKLAVVTNKMHEVAVPLIERWFGAWISVVVGEGNGIPKKPAPQGVQRALEVLDSTAERAIYLGDADVDVATAINAEVYPVGCTWGFRDRALLEAAGARAIIDSPAQLLALL